MKVVEMSVGHKNVVDRRKVFYPEPGFSKALEQEEPLRKVGIDHHVLTASLDEKSRVADESHSEIAIPGEDGAVHIAEAALHGGASHQSAELFCAAAKSHIHS